MPRGDKSAYTDKQKRKAEHIAEGYEDRGMPEERAEEIAWATVNKEDGGGNKSGSGRGKPDKKTSARRGGAAGGTRDGTGGGTGGSKGDQGRSAADRSAAARKGWETRRKNGNA